MLVAAAMPPRGLWPLAPLGLALLAIALAGTPWRQRAAVGATSGLAMTVTGLGLLWYGSGPLPPGPVMVAEVVAALVVAVIVGAAMVFVPARRGLFLGLPAVLVLAAAVQARWPFGGLPIDMLALSQVGGPLLPVAALAGQLGVTAAVAGVGVGLAALAQRRTRVTGVAVLVGVASVVAMPSLLPGVSATGHRSVAVVQGGATVGVAEDPDLDQVFVDAMRAGRRVRPPVDLVVLPEGTVHRDGPLAGRPARALADLARRLDGVVVAGVYERGADDFRNTAVFWSSAGHRIGQYVKVHGVPFAEYVPAREVIDRFVDLSLVPRDITEGSTPGVVRTAAGRLGTVISFEVLFARTVRATVQRGADLIVAPVNAGSFRGGQVPALLLAGARLRAVETGRWLAMAAPTGISAIVAPDGQVVARSPVGDVESVIRGRVEVRSGATPFVRTGSAPLLVAAVLAFVVAWHRDRKGGMPTMAGLTRDGFARGSATFGLAGALGFLVVLWGVGLLQGPTAWNTTVSEASVDSPLAALLVGGQIVHAASLVALGLSAHLRLPGRDVAGPAALVVAGVAGVGLVRFSCATDCMTDGLTPEEFLHIASAAIAGLAMAVAPVLIARRVTGPSDRWAAYGWLCLATSVVFAAGMLAWAGTAGRPGDGLAERVPIAVSAMWAAGTAWRLRRSGAPGSLTWSRPQRSGDAHVNLSTEDGQHGLGTGQH